MPFIQRKLHEALTSEPVERRIKADRVLREAALTEETVIDAESKEVAEEEHTSVIRLADYRRAVGDL